MNEYILNRETGKIELHFDKADYLALSEEQKKAIKSNFLFSRYAGAWVSRAKFPNTRYAEEIAQSLGLENGGKIGEMLTFEEQQQVKAEKAERRAERYEDRADRATAKGEQLQKPINDMHGDIAFFTQPNINTSAGRAFTNKRNKMWASYNAGRQEFMKSDYYREKAEAARQTAAGTKPTDKGFIDRRMKDAEKVIKAQQKNIEHYESLLSRIESGETLKRSYSDEVLTADTVERWIDDASDILEQAMSKYIYYSECMEELGGVQFSKDNIKVGYIVKIKNEPVEVISTGKVNITYRMRGFTLTAAYAEITEIVKESAPTPHPFKVGETFTIKEWSDGKYIDIEYTITKVTDEKVTIKAGTNRAKAIKPRRYYGSSNEWILPVADGHHGYYTKVAE